MEIAPFEHVFIQSSHDTQFSGSTTAIRFSKRMASFGHTDTHPPQDKHNLLDTLALGFTI